MHVQMSCVIVFTGVCYLLCILALILINYSILVLNVSLVTISYNYAFMHV